MRNSDPSAVGDDFSSADVVGVEVHAVAHIHHRAERGDANQEPFEAPLEANSLMSLKIEMQVLWRAIAVMRPWPTDVAGGHVEASPTWRTSQSVSGDGLLAGAVATCSRY